MKTAFLGLCFAGAALAAAPALAQDAVSNPARAAANVERDADRRPADVLAFVDVQPGDVVLDWGAGGGYWSEVFAGAVGADGKVYAQGARGPIAGFDNIEPLQMERGAPIPLEDGSVDLIILSYVYHHMYFAPGGGEATPANTQTQLAEWSRVLAPGGRVLVIDHQAKDGTTREAANDWHRAPKAAVIEDFTGAGLTLAAENPDIFNNPEDTEIGGWDDLRGSTTSMVLVFQTPE
jgi:predicted methyltransferase